MTRSLESKRPIVASASSTGSKKSIEVLLQLQDFLPQKRGVVMRLADWFSRKTPTRHVLPMNPRASRPVPPAD